jgi:hypothetical protein
MLSRCAFHESVRFLAESGERVCERSAIRTVAVVVPSCSITIAESSTRTLDRGAGFIGQCGYLLAAFFLLIAAQRFFCAAEIAARPAAESLPRRRPCRLPMVGTTLAAPAGRPRRRRRRLTSATGRESSISGKALLIATISVRTSARRARAPWAANTWSCSAERAFATDPPGQLVI